MEKLFEESIANVSRMRKISDAEMDLFYKADKAADELFLPEYEHYIKREFNPETPKILSKYGILGIPIKAEYGGLGMDPIISVLAKERLGQLGMGISSFINVQVFLCAQGIQRWGNEEQRNSYIPKMVKNEKVFCFGLTEPEAGSDPASLSTSYKKDGSGYRISGTKYLISNGTISDYMIAFARSDHVNGEISAFIVDMRGEGIERVELKEKIGLFTSDTGMITMDDVSVPEENLLGPIGKGIQVAYSSLFNARLGVAAGCVGVIEAALNASVKRARERFQHGKEIGKHQLIQGHLSAIRQNLEEARWPTYIAALKKGEYEKDYSNREMMLDAEMRISLAKRIASKLAFDSADRAVQIHGGFGYSLMSPVGQLFCDSRVARIYEGTDEIQDLKIASSLLGKEYEAYS